MNLKNLVAIDVHTHAWKSALQVDDKLTESQEAMGRYFRYQPQHQTVPEMAEMYRKLKMAFVVFTVDSPREPRKISNEESAELAHKNSDVAIPFASISPHRGAEGVAAARRLIRQSSVPQGAASSGTSGVAGAVASPVVGGAGRASASPSMAGGWRPPG